jgi:predicted nucleotidyltransferase/DNA-binding HxlR family transcriptional regulator
MKHDWIHPVSVLIAGELNRGERTIFELSKHLILSYNLVYRHVKKLEKAGLVRPTKRGKRVMFSLKGTPAVRTLIRLSEVTRFIEELKAANPKVRAAALEVVDTLEARFHYLATDVYFYGSFARGTSRRGSDVDVVVVAPEDYIDKIEAEIGDILTAHVFVMSREMFKKKVDEAGAHIKNVLAGIHLRLPF